MLQDAGMHPAMDDFKRRLDKFMKVRSTNGYWLGLLDGTPV